MTDVLTLAGIQFDDFSTPSRMPAGGNQTLVLHKLPGGSRVIDTLGPDESDIAWSGQFFGNDALQSALVLDGVRVAGQVVPLTFAGQYRSVIVNRFTYQIRRYPVWVEYQISCTVYQNPSLGVLGATLSTIDNLVLSDLALALSVGP